MFNWVCWNCICILCHFYIDVYLQNFFTLTISFQIWTKKCIYRWIIIGGMGKGRAQEKKENRKSCKNRVGLLDKQPGAQCFLCVAALENRNYILETHYNYVRWWTFPTKGYVALKGGYSELVGRSLLCSMVIILKIIKATCYFSLCFFLKREDCQSPPGGLPERGRSSCGASWHETSLRFYLRCFILVFRWASPSLCWPDDRLWDSRSPPPRTSLWRLQYLSLCLWSDWLWKIVHVSFMTNDNYSAMLESFVRSSMAW